MPVDVSEIVRKEREHNIQLKRRLDAKKEREAEQRKKRNLRRVIKNGKLIAKSIKQFKD